MTFTNSNNKRVGSLIGIVVGVAALCVALSIIMVVVTRASHEEHMQAITNRVPTPQTSPKEEETASGDPPFYGFTIYEGEITSVYFYPKGPNDAPSSPVTHVKFNHHEETPEELWLCGDHRNQFDVGSKYRLTVSFEPNETCVTNFQIK